MKVYFWFRWFLFIIAFLAGLWLLRGLMRRNITFVDELKNTFSGFSLYAQEDVNNKCALAREYYAQDDYQHVIDTLLTTFFDSPDIILRVSHCSQASLELAVSLKYLYRTVEENQVYQRIIDLNPANRDWIMHFAALELCQVALNTGNWQEAMEYWIIAYDSALNVPPETRLAYEERAWECLAKLINTMRKVVGNQKASELIQATQEKIPESASRFILTGYASEDMCDIDGAKQAYQHALDLAPQSIFINQHITILQNEQPACSP